MYLRRPWKALGKLWEVLGWAAALAAAYTAVEAAA